METVQFQIFMFSITLYGGLLIGLLYDVYRAINGSGRAKAFITSLWDILFLLGIFLVVVYIIFSGNFGDLRAYVFIGFIVGFFLYEKIIGRVFEFIFSRLFAFLYRMVLKIIEYIFIPLKLCKKFFIKPIIIIVRFFKVKAIKLKKVTLISKKSLKVFKKYYKLINKRNKY